MILKVKLMQGKGAGTKVYSNEVNSEDYNQLALVLNDLKVIYGLPVDKAIKKLQLSKSDWDAALGV